MWLEITFSLNYLYFVGVLAVFKNHELRPYKLGLIVSSDLSSNIEENEMTWHLIVFL